MNIAIDCLAVTGNDVAPWMPVTAFLLVAAGLGLILSGRQRRRRRATVGTLAVLAIAGGLVSSMIPASSATAASAPCTHQSTTASTTPAGPANPATPSTPATQSPVQPVRRGSISGTVTKNGHTLVITSPPAAYGTFPGTDWNLPTFQTVQGAISISTVTLTAAGGDHVFGTPDDTSTSVPVAADGTYSFIGLADGDYELTATLPDPAAGEPDQVWESPWEYGGTTTYTFGTTAWTWQTPAGGVASVAVSGGSDNTGQDFLAVNAPRTARSVNVF